MIALENDERRATLRAQFEKADSEIVKTLNQDARDFGSPFELRSKLNQARALREWAARQLKLLEPEQAH